MHEFEDNFKELDLLWKIFEFVRDNDDTYTDEEVNKMVKNYDLNEKENLIVTSKVSHDVNNSNIINENNFIKPDEVEINKDIQIDKEENKEVIQDIEKDIDNSL